MKPLIGFLLSIAKVVTTVLFISIFGLYVIQIVLRYIIGTTWLWAPDAIRLMFVWAVFLGASVLYAANGHLAVDALVTRFSETHQRLIAIFVELMALGFFAVVFFRGIEIAQKRMRIPFDTWDIPTGYAYAAVSVGAVLMFLIGIDRIADHIRALRKGVTPHVQ